MTLLAAITRYARSTLLRPELLFIFILCLILWLFASLRSDNWFFGRLGFVFTSKDVSENHPRRRFSGLNNGPGPPKLKFQPGKDYDDIDGEEKFSDNLTNDEPEIYWHKEDNMAVYGIQGRRPTMEDRYQYKKSQDGTVQVYGIFDGHGGSAASQYTREHLLDAILDRVANEKDLSKTDFPSLLKEEILSHDKRFLALARENTDVSGSTCVVALLHGDKLYVANVGDSRAVMKEKSGSTFPLSLDHKPNLPEEQKRIEKAGGYIAFFGVWRVVGILATSRAIGDLPLKDANVINAEADVVTVNLREKEAEFMIIATDGLWDVISNEEATEFISDKLKEQFLGSKQLVIQAFLRGSMDNISVMVVKLDGTEEESKN